MDITLNIARGLLGLTFIILVSYIFSTNRKIINWNLVLKGILVQIVIAVALLKVPFIYEIFNWISSFFVIVFQFANQGSEFLFGNMVKDDKTFGFIFALRVLPSIIFFSALSSLLYHLKVLPVIVKAFSKVMQKVFYVTGAESLSAAANIFLGHTEAPLFVRPYLSKMSISELHCLVVGGLATISGAILAACVGILGGNDPELQQFYAVQFLTASIISAPAAIVISKILMPETEDISQKINAEVEMVPATNMFDAIANGTFDGLKLAFNVGAMLLVFVSLIAMINYVMSDFIGVHTGLNALISSKDGFTMQYVFGIIFAPVAWILGVNSHDIMVAGQLLGEKTVINEFYAYLSMNDLINSGAFTDKRSIVIVTYALCGFSNFGSIGIMIGAISAMAPDRKADISRIVLRALLGGTLACFMTAAIAGMVF